MNIHFEKAHISQIDTIFSWLTEPYVQEFWDNTQSHKDDILNFVNGRKEPSNYCGGKYVYWVASCDDHPFAMIMTIRETTADHINDLKLNHLSKTGHTYGIDYMIGDKNYFGKGYGDKTLVAFLEFFRKDFDPKADRFIIDPASDNPRAKHVYMKAGFKHIADFIMGGDCSGAGKLHHLLIKRFAPNVRLLPATIADYPTIQNMARFYVYDRTSYMGWECPESGLFECIDFKHYFERLDEKAFLIRVSDEIAGFVLLDKMRLLEPVDWNMGEFFVLAKFQGQGIARMVAREIFKEHPGKWSIAVMPENIKAVKFWRKIIVEVSGGDFSEVFKTEDELRSIENPDPYAMNVFTFETYEKAIKERIHLAQRVTDVFVRALDLTDIPLIVEAFNNANWPKPPSIFETYFQEQLNSSRLTWVAYKNNQIAGYVTLKWVSQYAPFAIATIPEIMDLNVLPFFRKAGIGSLLLNHAEKAAATKSTIVGLGVGLYGGFDGGYGAAQKLYVNRGYIPNGKGVTYNYQDAIPGNKYPLDDDLVLWFTKKLEIMS